MAKSSQGFSTLGEVIQNLNINDNLFWNIIPVMYRANKLGKKQFDNDREELFDKMYQGVLEINIKPDKELPKVTEVGSSYRIKPQLMLSWGSYQQHGVIDSSTQIELDDPWLMLEFNYHNPQFIRQSKAHKFIQTGVKSLGQKERSIYSQHPHMFVSPKDPVNLHDHAIYTALSYTFDNQTDQKAAQKFIASKDYLDKLTLVYLIKAAQVGNEIARNFLLSCYIGRATAEATAFAKHIARSHNIDIEQLISDAHLIGLEVLKTLIGGDLYVLDSLLENQGDLKSPNINTRRFGDILKQYFRYMFLELEVISNQLQKADLKLQSTWNKLTQNLLEKYDHSLVEQTMQLVENNLPSIKKSYDFLKQWRPIYNHPDTTNEMLPILQEIETVFINQLYKWFVEKSTLIDYRDLATLNPRIWLISSPDFNPYVFKPSKHANLTYWLFGSIKQTVGQKLKDRAGGYYLKRLNDWWKGEKNRYLTQTQLSPDHFDNLSSDNYHPQETHNKINKQKRAIPPLSMLFRLLEAVQYYCYSQKKEKHFNAIFYKSARKANLIPNSIYQKNIGNVNVSDRHIRTLYRQFQKWCASNALIVHQHLP